MPGPLANGRPIEDMSDILRFVYQSHIPDRNVARLEKMGKSQNPQVASMAAMALKVAKVKPYRTRRIKFLAQNLLICCAN